jgi:hypothetical protein
MAQVNDISGLVRRCRNEPNLDRQVRILFEINRQLPSRQRLELPSLFTDDYVTRALDIIEEKLNRQSISRTVT